MLKIVVYDTGWGGEVVASFLSQELKTIEVIRAINWRASLCGGRDLPELYRRTQEYLRPYIGKVDLIVLGGYVVSLALDYLVEQYPGQKFVAMPIDLKHIPVSKWRLSQTLVFVNRSLIELPLWAQLQKNLPSSIFSVPNCEGWEDLINIGEMSSEVLRSELENNFWLAEAHSVETPTLPKTAPSLAQYFSSTRSLMSPRQTPRRRATSSSSKEQVRHFLERNYVSGDSSTPTVSSLQCYYGVAKPRSRFFANHHQISCWYRGKRWFHLCRHIRPDVIIVLNTHFWDIEEELSEVFGDSIPVIDFRKHLLHDVCLALGLRGVDGNLGRHS